MVYRFDQFEVDDREFRLSESGTPVQVEPKVLRLLVYLIENRNRLVRKQELLDKVWPDAMVTENALTRAIVLLRKALNEDSRVPRYLETIPTAGYRFIANVIVARDSSTVEFDTARRSVEGGAATGIEKWKVIVPAATAVLALSLGAYFYMHRSPKSPAAPPPWKLTRLTAIGESSDSPAMSQDGKLVAYSSDRDLRGLWDLYVKQISGGQPIRLTSDGAGNTSPDFSPDGSKIVFRSNRDGGGIYEIPAFGGEPKLLARRGLNPRYSPDGSQVAYWIGDPQAASTVPGSGMVWVVSSIGGQPQQVGPRFTNARYPIWSPDGKHVLFIGYTSDKSSDSSSLDWWLAPTNGDSAVRTGVYNALSRAGRQSSYPANTPSAANPNVPVPGCWLAGTNSVVFSAQSGDTVNLWETGISLPNGKVNGEFKRLTASAANDVQPSCASENAMAFTDIEILTDIWSLPIDLDRTRPKGPLEQITQDAFRRDHASLSGNGRFVAFASYKSGPLNIWVRDLKTDKETHLASSANLQKYPVISASGSRIAFSEFEDRTRSVYVSTSGGAPEKVCEGCIRATDWSRDEKSLLVFSSNPYQIGTLDVASHRPTAVLKHPTYNLLYGHFSPDNRWISFTARTQPDRGMILIAPLDGPKPIPESAWIKIADEGPQDWANWSPDGRTLYFTSARDGHTCLWAQRIVPGSHRPAGEAFAVQHFHGPALYQQGGWSVAGGRLAAILHAGTKNIWMMSRSSGP